MGRYSGTVTQLKMAQLVFLNERSHPTGDLNAAVAGQLLTSLTDVLLRIKNILPRISLISAEPLPTMQVGDGYSVAIWLNERGVSRERARFLLTLGQYAPFRVVRDQHGEADPGCTVYRNDGDVLEGVGLADLYGGFPVSFAQIERWRVPTLRLDAEQLLDDEERKWTFDIRHASLPNHVEVHRTWLTLLRRRDFEDVADLCQNRAELFPCLEFCHRIQDDLECLQPPALRQVVDYLHRLNDSVENWNPLARPRPDYPPNTTDESEGRKPLCNFPTPSGTIAPFT